MSDKQIFDLLVKEKRRQLHTLMMIPSENYSSRSVRRLVGSCLMNKYGEGYPTKRYYQGIGVVDEIETLAIERAKKLFGVPYANVQPLSGSPANAAIYFALLEPGDKIMGLALDCGGHLTHGHPKITFSGRYFTSVQYRVGDKNLLDYKEIEKLALKEKPKIIVSGLTAYPRNIDYRQMNLIAQKVGAWHLADVSHLAGLIAGGVSPSPVGWADVVMTTTHKTLRGPRGAIIMVTKKGLQKDPLLAQRIDRAVFPGLQGGPHFHTIAGIAACLKAAQSIGFKAYAKRIIRNARVLAIQLKRSGFTLVTGGTDNHLILIDLRNFGIDGLSAAIWLEKAGIIVNKNSIPNDPNPPAKPSGIRLGTPAISTRKMKEAQMRLIADWIAEVISSSGDDKVCLRIKKEVRLLCRKFPIS